MNILRLWISSFIPFNYRHQYRTDFYTLNMLNMSGSFQVGSPAPPEVGPTLIGS